MSWMSKKTGRPRGEGYPHKRIDISVSKEIFEGLKKIREGGGNYSQFIRKILKPYIESLDPGEASPYIWAIETTVTQWIIEAAQEGKPSVVQALGSVMDALKPHRSLSGPPPPNFEASLVGGPKLTERERELRELEAEMYALKEEILMTEDKYNSESIEEKAKRRQKYRKIVGLI